MQLRPFLLLLGYRESYLAEIGRYAEADTQPAEIDISHPVAFVLAKNSLNVALSFA